MRPSVSSQHSRRAVKPNAPVANVDRRESRSASQYTDRQRRENREAVEQRLRHFAEVVAPDTPARRAINDTIVNCRPGPCSVRSR